MLKKQFGLAPIAIILIIAGILILGGGAYYWQKHKAAAPAQTACSTEAKICPDGSAVGRTGPNCEFALCPTANSTSTSLVDTSDWKSYRNDEYGFELKYPSYLFESTTTDIAPGFYPLLEANKKDLNPDHGNMLLEDFGIRIDSRKSYKSFEELWQENIKKSQSDEFGSPSGLKKMLNISGLTYEIVTGDAAYFSAVILHNNSLIDLSYTCVAGSDNNCGYRRDQILSTFKFIK